MLIAHSTKLGEILIEDGLISQQQLDETLQLQRASGKRLAGAEVSFMDLRCCDLGVRDARVLSS